eukprot:14585885-Heterocapsa_arctica.AAC.1
MENTALRSAKKGAGNVSSANVSPPPTWVGRDWYVPNALRKNTDRTKWKACFRRRKWSQRSPESSSRSAYCESQTGTIRGSGSLQVDLHHLRKLRRETM